MKRVEPAINILHRKPGEYKPSWLMQWKRDLIPHLQGHYGLYGKYRNQVTEGTAWESGSNTSDQPS